MQVTLVAFCQGIVLGSSSMSRQLFKKEPTWNVKEFTEALMSEAGWTSRSSKIFLAILEVLIKAR